MLASIHPYSSFAEAFGKVEQTLKRIITVRGSFWCDSHPWLCKCCHRLRWFIKYRQVPEHFFINTRRGTYIA